MTRVALVFCCFIAVRVTTRTGIHDAKPELDVIFAMVSQKK
jgi:hypothetical protein